MIKDDVSIENLSKLIIFSKYAKYDEGKQRRETWEEIVERITKMHINKFPKFETEIQNVFKFVTDKKLVPSMRSMQFGGKPIELNNSRIYNCSALAIKRPKDFAEVIFLLLSGSGVGISVQSRHTELLPPIQKPTKVRKFLVGDSIEGWSDAIRALFKSYMSGSTKPLFDYSDIRKRGMPLKTAGGKAPGAEPLRRCINKIESILDSKDEGSKLRPIDVYDIVCHIADCVLSGGIRRSAILTLFDKDDALMLNCKGNFGVETVNGGFHFNPTTNTYEGEVFYKNKAHFISLNEWSFNEFSKLKTLPWYYFEPQRARSNNSVVMKRSNTTRDEFESIFEKTKKSGAGEPGFFWTNNYDILANPCVVGDTLVLTNIGWIKIKNLELYPDVKIITQDAEGKLCNSELKWSGITKKMDNIYRVNFDNGEYILCNKSHKLYDIHYNKIEIENIKIGDEILIYKNVSKIIQIDKLDYQEDVYDLTATPNYNFFSILNIQECIVNEKIKINDEIYFNYFDIVETINGQKFAFDLDVEDELIF